MAYNFTIQGVGVTVNFGKGNPTVSATSSLLKTMDSAGAALVEHQGATPTLNDSFTTKSYVDNAVAGLKWKEPVAAATTVAGTLATDFENGDVIDGITLATNDRILIKDQASGVENGIYIVQASGAPVRASDMAAGSGAAGAAMFVEGGTANGDVAFVCTNDSGSDIVNTSALVFVACTSALTGITTIALAGTATGVSPIDSGTGPTATLRGFLGESGVLTASISGEDVVYAVDTGGIATAKLADDAVTEAKLDQGVAVLYRQVAIAFGDWPAATGSNQLAMGATIPTGGFVMDSRVIVTTAFDNSALLQVGISASPGAVQTQSEIDLEVAGTYVSDRGSDQSGAQLQIDRETGAIAPTAGAGIVVVAFINP